jgi:hypothetical protein
VSACSGGVQDLNQHFADGCEFKVTEAWGWLSRIEVSGGLAIGPSAAVFYGDTGAQAYDLTAAEPRPVARVAAAGRRFVTAATTADRIYLGAAVGDGSTGAIHRVRLLSPLGFDTSPQVVSLSKPPSSLAALGERLLVSNESPGQVQLYDLAAGTFRFVGSITPFAGQPVRRMVVDAGLTRGFALGAGGAVRAFALSTGANPVTAGDTAPAPPAARSLVAAALVDAAGPPGLAAVTLLADAAGGGSDLLRVLPWAAATGFGAPIEVVLPTAQSVAIDVEGAVVRVLDRDGGVTTLDLSASEVTAEHVAGAAGFGVARAWVATDAGRLVATSTEVSVLERGVDAMEHSAGTPVDLTPTDLVEAPDLSRWVATGASGIWRVEPAADGALSVEKRSSRDAGLLASRGDVLASLSADGTLDVRRFEGGAAGALPLTLDSAPVDLAVGPSQVAVLTGTRITLAPYALADDGATVGPVVTTLAPVIAARAAVPVAIAWSDGLLVVATDRGVAVYDPGDLGGAPRLLQDGGQTPLPLALAASHPGTFVMLDPDRGAALVALPASGDLALPGTALPSAVTGIAGEARNQLAAFDGLFSRLSPERGLSLLWADPDGAIRIGLRDSRDNTVPGYLAPACPAVAHQVGSEALVAATTCGLDSWRHRAP